MHCWLALRLLPTGSRTTSITVSSFRLDSRLADSRVNVVARHGQAAQPRSTRVGALHRAHIQGFLELMDCTSDGWPV
ncbi:hypothetical protein C8Q77DRAFT_1100859, partial [Trametes polyzona]